MKIAIVNQGSTIFIGDIVNRLSKDHDIAVMDANAGLNYPQIFEDFDLIWAEWCGPAFAQMSRFKGKAKLVCRLHRYEMFMNLEQIYWPNVYRLIFVAEPAVKMFDKLHPGVEVNKIVINNGLNLSKYKLEEITPGFDIAWVGYLNVRKNPGMMIQILQKLVEVDQRYMVHVAGKWQDKMLYYYCENLIQQLGLEKNIMFHDWVDDMNGFLSSCQYLLSTSMHESFGYAIMEGMAKGLLPVLHNYPGASETYPQEYLFNTIDDAVDMIQYSEINPGEYRCWVEQYSLDNQITQINNLLTEIGGSR